MVKYKGRLKRSVLETKMHGQAVTGELLPFLQARRNFAGGTACLKFKCLNKNSTCMLYEQFCPWHGMNILESQMLCSWFHCRMGSRSLQLYRVNWFMRNRSFSLRSSKLAHLLLHSKGFWAFKVEFSIHTPGLAQAEAAPPLKTDSSKHHRWCNAPIFGVQIWTDTKHMQSRQA